MQWRVACSVPGQQAAAVKALLELGVPAVSPYETITEHRTLSRRYGRTRKVTYERRLFGNYLFAVTDDRALLLKPRQVDRVLVSATSGEMLHVRPRQMTVILDNMQPDGLVKAEDRTKISLSFTGKVGDLFEFTELAGSAAGHRGQIVSVDHLDDKETVDVEWFIFGRATPMTVPLDYVGNIVRQGVALAHSGGARRMAGAAA